MTANVWDNKVSQTPGAQTALGGYTHIKELLQAMPYDPNNAQTTAAGNKLQDALTTKTFGVPTGVNGDYAGKLDRALADKATRDKIVKLSQENPAALNQAMDQIVKHPENVTVVNSIPLPSEQQVAQAAPPKPALQAPTIKTHTAPAGSGSVVTAQREPVSSAPAKTPASSPPTPAPREKPPVVAEQKPNRPVVPSSPGEQLEKTLGSLIGSVSNEAINVAKQTPILNDPKIIGTLSEISKNPNAVARQVISGANSALEQLNSYAAHNPPYQQLTQMTGQQMKEALTPSIIAPNDGLKESQPLSTVQTKQPTTRIAMSLKLGM